MFEAGVGLDAKVASLRRPATYPARPASIEAIETHMSWVFLTPDHVFKLKKPVRSDGLDFSTLERRRFYCTEELRLNRRLAPAVYLDVVALRQGPDGTLALAATGGVVVDWLVMMRRLAADLMLDALLARGRAGVDQMRQVAAQLAAFHRRLPPALHDPMLYGERLAGELAEQERRLCDPELAFDEREVRPVAARLRGFLRGNGAVLAARVAAGRVVEGHGDLRPEHVWLGTPPAIIDCLEFSLALRTVDGIDEAAFLAMECERAGAADLGRVLLERYAALADDAVDPALVHFYQGLRAFVRAGLALWHLKEAHYRGSPRWRQRAADYLQLAARHALACAPAG